MNFIAFDENATATAGPATASLVQRARVRREQPPGPRGSCSGHKGSQSPPLPSEASRPSAGLAPWQVKRTRAYIDAHLADSLPLARIAGRVRLSTSRFSRCFRRSFGLSYLKFLRGERLRRAEHLLLTTDMRLCDVAIQCGFSDQAHFTRLFHQHAGFAPAQWRRRVRIVGGASLLVSARLRAET